MTHTYTDTHRYTTLAQRRAVKTINSFADNLQRCVYTKCFEASPVPVKQRRAPDENVVGRVRHCGDAVELKFTCIGVQRAVDCRAQRPLALCQHTATTHTASSYKGKERKDYLYSGIILRIISKRSGMDHTVLPANTPCPVSYTHLTLPTKRIV